MPVVSPNGLSFSSQLENAPDVSRGPAATCPPNLSASCRLSFFGGALSENAEGFSRKTQGVWFGQIFDETRLSNQLLAHRIEDDFSRIMQIEFLHQVGSVTFDGIWADVQNSRDVFVCFPFSQ